jgi:hypothetical protein
MHDSGANAVYQHVVLAMMPTAASAAVLQPMLIIDLNSAAGTKPGCAAGTILCSF